MSNGNRRDAEPILLAMAEMLNEYFRSESEEVEAADDADLLPDLLVAPANAENTSVADPTAPWACADPLLKKPFQLRMSEERYLKLKWLSANLVPHRSMHQLVMDILQESTDDLINKHYVKVKE